MKRTLLAVAIMLISGCVVRADNDKDDDVASAKDQIRWADLALARAVAEHSVNDFSALIHQDAVCFAGGMSRGRKACVEAWTPLIQSRKRTLKWRPDEVTVSQARDLGYSIGRYESAGMGPDGKPRVATGTYVTVWKRDSDGRWRLAVDIGTAPEPKTPPGAQKPGSVAEATAEKAPEPALDPAPTWKQELARQRKRSVASKHAASQPRAAARTASGGADARRQNPTLDPAPTWQQELARQRRKKAPAGARTPAPQASPVSSDAPGAKPPAADGGEGGSRPAETAPAPGGSAPAMPSPGAAGR